MEPEEQTQEKINPFKETPSQSERVNPFKDLPRPRQPHLEKEKKSQEKEITIKLKPWRLVKGLFVVALLFGIFFVGRLTAGSDSMSLPDFYKLFSYDSGPSGLATGDTTGAGEAEAIKEEAPAEPNETEETQLAEAEESKESAEAVEEKPEKIVGEDYSKVSLSIDGVYKDWKGTWGKIKGIKYTITNNEEGTIRPHHFAMVVEGYEDGEKHFDVSYTSQKVKAGQSLTDEAAVSGGFAYSPVTIPDGDLSKVRISLFLLDADSETMASVHQEVDLSE